MSSQTGFAGNDFHCNYFAANSSQEVLQTQLLGEKNLFYQQLVTMQIT